MASSNKPASSPRRSWRRERQIDTSPGARIAKRLLLTALGLVLAAIFVFAIWTFVTPGANLHFYSLAVVDYSDQVPLPIAFCKRDSQEIEDLKNTNYIHDLQLLDARTSGHAEGMEKIAGRIKTQNKDVLIFYLNAHGVSDDGKAYVLCGDYDPAKSDSGRIPLTTLLDQIKRCPGQLKLVLLDSGRIRSDVRLGMAMNEFPQLLQTVELQDPHVWILNSNSIGEVSGLYHPERGSIFLHFVTQGLKGLADGYGNGNKKDDKVDLKELWEFVHDHVSAWADLASAGNESQTPMLLRGDGKQATPDSSSVLVRLRKPKEDTNKKEDANKKDTPEKPPESSEGKQAFFSPIDWNTLHQQRRTYLANVQEKTSKSADSAKPDSNTKKKTNSDQVPSDPADGADDSAGDANKQSTGTKKAGPDADTSAKPTGKASGAAQPTNQRLMNGWVFRDSMEARSQGQPSPIDYAPHLWREFQDQLLVRELHVRSGAADSQNELVTTISQLIDVMPRELGRAEPKDHFRSLKARPHALAVTHLFKWNESEARPAEEFRKLQEQIADLVKLPAEEFAEQFTQWASKPELEPFRFISEVGFALRLKQRAEERPNDPRRWEKVQLALATRQSSEQAAASADWCKPWVQKLVEEGDSERVAGERALFAAGAGPNQALDSLRNARARYRAALQNTDAIKQAYELRNDLTFYAPHYVRSQDLFPATNVAQLLQDLRQLTILLDEGNSERVEELTVFRDKLDTYRVAIAGALQSTVDVLGNNPLGRGNAAKIERLLSSPLLRAAQRQKLLEGLDAAEKEATKKLLEFKVIRAATSQPPDRSFDRLTLESELVRLVGKQLVKSTGSGDSADIVMDAIGAAESSLKSATASSGSARSAAIRELGTALKRFYVALPASVQASKPTQDLELLQARERILRAIDGRDVGSVRAAIGTRQDPIEAIRLAKLFSLLAWQQERLDRLRQISAPAERDDLFQAALICNRLAKAIPNQPELQPPSFDQAIAAMDCRPPEKLRLGVADKLAIKVSPIQRQTLTKLSLVLVFDPRLVEITAPARENAALDGTSLRVGIDLLPDDPKTIGFDIKAKQESDELATVTAQLMVGDRVESEESLKLNMPEPQVVVFKVTGLKGTVTQEKKTLLLRPFPGHNNDYHFELSARKPREVRLQVRALADPMRDSDRRRVEESGQLPFGGDINLKLDSDFITVSDEKPTSVQFEPFKGDAERAGPSLSNGLVCVLEEKDTKKRSFYWIDIAPLHPNEYLKAEFAREFAEGEVKIQVKPVGTFFPPGGSTVELELLKDEIPRGKKGTAKLDNAEAQDFISIKLDPDRRRNLLVRLHADGYPRAFVYDVDVTQNRSIPRRGGLREIRVGSPRKIYAPRPSIPVTVAIDAPNAFRDPDTRIELAWNAKMAGPGAAPTKRFSGERSFNSTLLETKEDGTFVISAQVTDFEYEVPAAGIENQQLEIVARLLERERPDLVSERLQIVVDGTPPVFGSLECPDRVEVGQPLKVAARISDESPIEKVEFALSDRFDPDKFEKLETKKDGVFDQDRGVYIAQLATEKLEPGDAGLRYSVVVRARNENLDKWGFETKAVLIAPKSAKASGVMVGEVVGTVVAYNEIQPGATLILTPKDAATIAKVTTAIPPKAADKDGKFKFENLPAGTYTLTGSVKSGAYTFRTPKPLDVVVQAGGTHRVKVELRML